MSVQSELDRIISAIGAAYDAVEAKGGTVPQSETVAGLAAAVQSIQTGGGEENLFHATITPATADEVVTVELADHPREVKALIAIVQSKDIGEKLSCPYVCVFLIPNATPTSNSNSLSSLLRGCLYKDNNSNSRGSNPVASYINSVPDGAYEYRGCYLWFSATYIPRVKFYVCEGTDKKYGLLIGRTYDVWAIF